MEKVNKNGPIPPASKKCKGRCWEWTAYCMDNGYGHFGVRKGNQELAHRFSWMIFNGDIPDGILVLHRCDNRKCVNPDHLWLGTYSDNNWDKVHKRRHCFGKTHHSQRMPEVVARGETVGTSKLTADNVREIRAAYTKRGDMVTLAKRFSVCVASIYMIVNRQTWKHI